jgi:glycosyltransferase involved in cell wall biosynthesis
VVPLRAGGGMRVKILDAWARGIPIVSTTIGAEGITYNSGTDILIADTPEEFSRAVSQVLIDNDLAKRLSQYGRETLENHYDWKKVYPAWDRVYNPAFDSNNRQQI